MIKRRAFLAGMLAAPLVVRQGLIMPIKPLPPELPPFTLITRHYDGAWMLRTISRTMAKEVIIGKVSDTELNQLLREIDPTKPHISAC